MPSQLCARQLDQPLDEGVAQPLLARIFRLARCLREPERFRCSHNARDILGACAPIALLRTAEQLGLQPRALTRVRHPHTLWPIELVPREREHVSLESLHAAIARPPSLPPIHLS